MAFDVNKVLEEVQNPVDHTAEYDAADAKKNGVISLFSYLSILLLIPFFAANDSKFARFHVNQGLMLLIADVVLGLVGELLGLIPVVGTIFKIVFGLAVLAATIFGIYNAVTGKAKEIPFIGKYTLVK